MSPWVKGEEIEAPTPRHFDVYVKDKHIPISADQIHITDYGTLTFHLNRKLVASFSPSSGWWVAEN